MSSRHNIYCHSNGVTLNLLLIYCVYAFAVTGFIEVFSLWAYTRPDLGMVISLLLAIA